MTQRSWVKRTYHPVLDRSRVCVFVPNAKAASRVIKASGLEGRAITRFDNEREWFSELGKLFASNDDRFVFTFVRNPYSRAVSTWQFMMHELGVIPDSVSFTAFCETLLRRGVKWNWHLHHQADAVISKADFVGKMETLAADWQSIAGIIDAPPRLPDKKEYRGASMHHWDAYTTKAYRIISKVYERDIDTFRYHFKDA